MVCETREQALEAIEKELNNHDAQWSREIKIRARWTCEYPGCGEIDKTLLESHHIKSREQFPELMHEISNGRCLCLYHHAFAHTGIVRDHILARLAVILYRRMYPERFKDKEDQGGETIHKR